jgi:Mitochondrial import receptor subunit Tom22
LGYEVATSHVQQPAAQPLTHSRAGSTVVGVLSYLPVIHLFPASRGYPLRLTLPPTHPRTPHTLPPLFPLFHRTGFPRRRVPSRPHRRAQGHRSSHNSSLLSKVSKTASFFKRTTKFAGNAIWVVTTSALLIGLPLALILEDEAKVVAQENEMLAQQQDAQQVCSSSFSRVAFPLTVPLSDGLR